MKVLKFGGTSLGSAKRMKNVAELVLSSHTNSRKIVVLSAVSGTTNSLVAISAAFKTENFEEGKQLIEKLREKYDEYTAALFDTESYRLKAETFLAEKFGALHGFAKEGFSNKDEKTVLAQGELIATQLMEWHLAERDVEAVLLSAFDFMRTKEQEPDLEYIEANLRKVLNKYAHSKLFILQGYICLNEHGEIDNLQRGGSDYTASLVGAAIGASEIQIWTDIDGMHNNDPRIVDKTYPIHEMSFDEAAELAYFGAKILHPASVRPAQQANIPVRLLNTMAPEAEGTIIMGSNDQKPRVTAVAAKDGIVAIKVKSSRMLLAYGFLRKVFEVFEKYKTPIDVITTSEVAVSLTIDDTTHLEAILTELKGFGIVEFDNEQTIICVVGNFLQQDTRIAINVLQILKDIPIRMISYGGSKHNITMVFHKDYKIKALKALNDELFQLH